MYNIFNSRDARIDCSSALRKEKTTPLSNFNMFACDLMRYRFNPVFLFQNILDKFNPGARQLINAGKAYLKALHGEWIKLSMLATYSKRETETDRVGFRGKEGLYIRNGKEFTLSPWVLCKIELPARKRREFLSFHRCCFYPSFLHSILSALN